MKLVPFLSLPCRQTDTRKGSPTDVDRQAGRKRDRQTVHAWRLFDWQRCMKGRKDRWQEGQNGRQVGRQTGK